MRHTPYQTIQILFNPLDVMGVDLGLVEKELVINTWLWRNYELTANDFRLSLKDELECLIAEQSSYPNKVNLEKLLIAYSGFDLFIQNRIPRFEAINAHYAILCNTIVLLSFTVPFTTSYRYE